MTETGQEPDLEALWAEVNRLLREGPVNRALWDAAETAKPLALEEGTLILGLTAANFRHASYLQTDVNRAKLRQLLEQSCGRSLDLRVIQGATGEDWERTKQREREAEQKAVAGIRRAASFKGAEAVWEAVYHEVNQVFTGVRARAYGTTQARLLVKALPLVYRAEQAARAEEPGADEAHERQLNRVLDRIATNTGLASTAVALEYLRYAASQKRSESG
jgi:hypothetical protein